MWSVGFVEMRAPTIEGRSEDPLLNSRSGQRAKRLKGTVSMKLGNEQGMHDPRLTITVMGLPYEVVWCEPSF